MKLNIGCGFKKLDGYINIDENEKWSPDIVRDVNKGLPFSDNTIDEIYSNHFVEHLEDLVWFMQECHRVLKTNGRFIATFPPFPDIRIFSSPFHKRVLTRETFRFFTPGYDSNETAKLDFHFKWISEKAQEYNEHTVDYTVILEPIK